MKNLTTLGSFLLATTWSASAVTIASYEFNGANNGWTSTNIVDAPALSTTTTDVIGEATSNDPQLKRVGLTLDVTSGASWDSVVFRVRETETFGGAPIAFDPVGLIVQINTGAGNTPVTISAAAISEVDSGGGYFTVTADISGVGTTQIKNIRLDPIGGAAANSNSETNGNFFAVDFIQVNDTSIPEPSSALLSLLAGGLLFSRRRK